MGAVLYSRSFICTLSGHGASFAFVRSCGGVKRQIAERHLKLPKSVDKLLHKTCLLHLFPRPAHCCPHSSAVRVGIAPRMFFSTQLSAEMPPDLFGIDSRAWAITE
jgi:hypothetical protein